MKYQTIVENEFSDKIGSVIIGTQPVQLCDHIQLVEGSYRVSALYDDNADEVALHDMGGLTKTMYNGTKVVYLTENMVDDAQAVYQDGMTPSLIARLKKALAFSNKHHEHQAA